MKKYWVLGFKTIVGGLALYGAMCAVVNFHRWHDGAFLFEKPSFNRTDWGNLLLEFEADAAAHPNSADSRVQGEFARFGRCGYQFGYFDGVLAANSYNKTDRMNFKEMSGWRDPKDQLNLFPR